MNVVWLLHGMVLSICFKRPCLSGAGGYAATVSEKEGPSIGFTIFTVGIYYPCVINFTKAVN